MKVYYWESETWNEITDIINYPDPQTRISQIGYCSLVIRDFEGALYNAWKDRNFIPMKVEDDSSNILFRGFLKNKHFKHDQLTLTLVGLGSILEWTEFENNYVLEQGKVLDVPASLPGNESTVNPDSDVSTQWDCSQGDHYDALLQYNPPISSTAVACVDEFTMGTITAASIQKIRIYIYGLRQGYPGRPPQPQGDIYVNGGWVGYQYFAIPDASGWTYIEITGTWDQADLNALKVRLYHAGVNEQQSLQIFRMYAKIFYTGLVYDSLGLEDLSDPPQPFDWSADYWNSGFQDKGMIISDNTSETIFKTWDASAETVTGGTKVGDFNGTLIKDDCNYLRCEETSSTIDGIIELDIDGEGVPTTHYLQRIEIDFQFGDYVDIISNNILVAVNLEIKKDTSWISLDRRVIINLTSSGTKRTWIDNPTVIIEDINTELAKYLDIVGDNYTSLKGLRFKAVGYAANVNDKSRIEIDYISVRVYHNTQDVSPIMKQISDSEDSWVKCTGITDWTTTGIAVGDSFKIGESTNQILNDISGKIGISIDIQSTLTKYMARWFKGTDCLEVLNAVCLLEGCFWIEDYINNKIIIIKLADFASSGINITQANYDWDWIFEDQCNHFYKVEVFGCAALGIYAEAHDDSVDSPMVKQFIEESIMTVPDAQEVADTQLAIWKVKTPSIRIPLEGVNIALQVGTTVNLTLSKPPINATDYPIRMIERSKFGIDDITTIIYAGLGHSEVDETIGTKVRKTAYLAKKAHTDRIISTPPGEGAVFTWSQIGGKDSGVRSIITAELVDGQTIDNAIDALITAEGHPAHNLLGGLNDGDVYEHISQAQKTALHAIYTLEVHDNTKHNPNYSAEGHLHDDRYYTETEINANTYTRAQVDAHNWLEADITDLDHLTEGEISLANLLEKSHLSLTNVTANQHHVSFIQGDADALYSVLAHLHDDRYYTETEIGNKVFEQSVVFPGAPSEGDFHYDEDDDSLYRYNAEAEAWIEVGTMGAIAGSVDNLGNHTATEDLDMDTNKILNIVNPTTAQGAATKIYVETYADYVSKHGVASDDLVFSNDTERFKLTTLYTKIKEIRVYHGTLNLRVYWEAKAGIVADVCKTRVYVNGVAVGAEKSNTTTSYVAFTTDVTVHNGDLLQIYGMGYVGESSINIYVRNMRIKFFIEYVSTGGY